MPFPDGLCVSYPATATEQIHQCAENNYVAAHMSITYYAAIYAGGGQLEIVVQQLPLTAVYSLSRFAIHSRRHAQHSCT